MTPSRAILVVSAVLLSVAFRGGLAGETTGGAKVLRYAFEIAETGFDPAQISDLYSRDVACEIFDAPLRFAYLAPPGTVEPNTAQAMPEVSSDFRTLTFHIRPGIYFADDPAFGGRKRELTAEDYVYSYKRIFDPHWKSPSYGGLEPAEISGMKALRDEALRTGRFDYDRTVDGLRTLDRYTFQIRLGHPDPRFATNFADASLFGAVAREVVERYADRIMEHPVGTGPFMLTAWRKSSAMTLERNPNFREEHFHAHPAAGDRDAQALAARFEGRTLPMIDRVEISVIEESQPRWLAFLNGEHDLLYRLPRDLPPIAIPRNEPSPALIKRGIRVERVPEIDFTLIPYNMEDAIVGGYAPAQVALRRALNLAIDVDEMIAAMFKFQAVPAQSVMVPATYGYDASLRTEMGSFDPGRANALLDVYGYARGTDGWRLRPDGGELRLVFNTEPDQRQRIMAEILRRSFDRIGVHLEFKFSKWAENLKMAQEGHFMAWPLALSAASADGADALQLFFSPQIGGYNFSRFKLPEFDRIYREQNEMPDGPERLAKIRRLNELLLAYAPLKTIVHRYRVDMTYPWVVGYRVWPFVYNWWRYIDIDRAAQHAAAH